MRRETSVATILRGERFTVIRDWQLDVSPKINSAQRELFRQCRVINRLEKSATQYTVHFHSRPDYRIGLRVTVIIHR